MHVTLLVRLLISLMSKNFFERMSRLVFTGCIAYNFLNGSY